MKDVLKYIVAVAVLLSFGFSIYVLSFRAIPIENKELFVNALGILQGAVITLVSFHFGSSQGSKDKTDVIQTLATKQIEKLNPPPPVDQSEP